MTMLHAVVSYANALMMTWYRSDSSPAYIVPCYSSCTMFEAVPVDGADLFPIRMNEHRPVMEVQGDFEAKWPCQASLLPAEPI